MAWLGMLSLEMYLEFIISGNDAVSPRSSRLMIQNGCGGYQDPKVMTCLLEITVVRDGDTTETALGIKGDLLAHISRKPIGT